MALPIQQAPEVMPSSPSSSPVTPAAPPLPRPDYPNVTAGSFGAAVGRGAEQLGEGLLKAAQFYNAAAADEASNYYEEQVTKILRGDPAIKNPDGTPDTGFFGLKGRAAMDAREGTQKKLDDLLAKTRGTLENGEQALRFDNFSRRFKAITMTEMGRYADDQSKVWQSNVQGATVKNAIEKVSRSDQLDRDFYDGLQDAMNGRVIQAQVANGGPETEKQAMELGRREIWEAKLNVIAVKDPARALQLAEEHREELGSRYDDLWHKFHARAEDDGADTTGAATLQKYGLAGGTGQPPQPGAPRAPGAPVTQSSSGGVVPGLSPTMGGVLQDSEKDLGFKIPISSGRRTEEEQRKAGPARQSKHLSGEAIDIPLAGMPEDQQKKIVERFLSDPRVGGFEYVPGHHMHIDVRQGAKWAGGPDGTSGSVGQNWPAWLTDRVAQWRGPQAAPRQLPTDNMERAQTALEMTPQERNLYQHHLTELGRGGVVNRDRSVSSVLEITAGIDGKTYVLPTVWEGKVYSPSEAIEKAKLAGLDNFPSYSDEMQAKARYDKMHDFMEIDTERATSTPAASPEVQQQQKSADIAARRAAAIRDTISNPNLSPKQKQRVMSLIEHAASADMMQWQAEERDKKVANDTAADEWVSKFAPGKPINPSAISQIMGDKRLNWQTKEHLVDIARKQSGSDVEANTLRFGPGFYEVYRRVTADPDDPKRINDPNEIYKRAGINGDLTQEGAQHLRQVMKEMRDSVESSAVQQSAAHQMAFAKSFLSFDGKGAGPGWPGLKDYEGERIFNSQFAPQFLFGLRDWIKDGKNPREYLTEENVKKIATPMRDRAKMARDELLASGQAPQEANAPLPPTPQGVNEDTWTTLMKNGPLNKDGTRFAAPVWAQAVNRLRANPTEKEKKLFNEAFEDYGFNAETILERLKRPPASTSASPSATGGRLPYQMPSGAGPAVPTGVLPQTPSAPGWTEKDVEEGREGNAIYGGKADVGGAIGRQVMPLVQPPAAGQVPYVVPPSPERR